MSSRVPGGVRWLLALASLVVPAHRRRMWRRQWVAEIEHRCQGAGAGRGLVRFAWGSLTHAFYLRREEMGMRGYLADLRHSARALARRPGFSALAVATLAIGIGAATAIFSLAETLLLRPLPLENSERLVRIYSTNASTGFGSFSVSYPDYVDFAARTDLFEAAAFYVRENRDVAGGGDPERIQTISVDERFFQTLGSQAHLGRLFGTDDHDPRNELTAVLGESFWASRFGRDSTAIGRTVRLDGVPHSVIGVVEDGYTWPGGAQVWVPLQWGGSVPDYAAVRSNHMWQVIGLLQPGVDVRTASAQVRAVAQAAYSGADINEREQGMGAIAAPLRASAGGEEVGPILSLLGAAVFLVLLIACLNASDLLLTRAWSRTRELSLRSALGAGRGRLAWILLGESAVLASLGGGVGVLVGYFGLQQLFRIAPPEVTRLGDVELNTTVLAVALGFTLLAALMAGLIPALRASRTSVAESLKEGGGQAGQARSGTRLRRGLVVVELALSLVLLIGAGLTIRGFERQIAADPGFQASNVLSFTVRLPGATYGEEALVQAYYAEAITRLERHPGILAATSTSRLPLGAGGFGLFRSFIFDGAPPPEGVEYPAAWVEIDEQYLETIGVRPTEGRGFSADDNGDGPLVAIVNERLARQMSPNEPMVSKQIRSFHDQNLTRTVVGVVPDLQFSGISREGRTALVLVPRSQAVRASMAFLVRTAGDPNETIPAVRQAMGELDPNIALDALQSLREAHQSDLAGFRFLTTLFTTFGALALALAVSGVYGLVSYSVSQRTREIGVRMAMGATTGSVRASVLRERAVLAAIGVGIGLMFAYGGSRLLSSAMQGIAIFEVSTFAAVALLLSSAVLLASWFPATRATRVDPVDALRSD